MENYFWKLIIILILDATACPYTHIEDMIDGKQTLLRSVKDEGRFLKWNIFVLPHNFKILGF